MPNGLHLGNGIHPGYRRAGEYQFATWTVHCSHRICQDRHERRFGHSNYFTRPSKAAFAKELIHDGWTYRGGNRWWCGKCSAVAAGKRIIKQEDWGLFRAVLGEHVRAGRP